jgi:hypothetical protein
MQTMIQRIPHWLAWPMSALSTLAAIGGAALFFFSAVYADYGHAVWGGVLFASAALAWYVGDMAAANRPLD